MKLVLICNCRAICLFFSVLLAFLVVPQSASAQTEYSIKSAKAGNISISGTSDLQDWTITSRQMQGLGTFTVNEQNQLTAITAFRFSVPVYCLKSGIIPMDRKAYKALKAKKHPTISFLMQTAQLVEVRPNQYDVTGTGGLTINGVTRTVTIKLVAEVGADQSIALRGTHALKFSDFIMKVPSFMGGAMQAGNEVVVKFTLPLSPTLAAAAK